jgi:hypothetical protein
MGQRGWGGSGPVRELIQTAPANAVARAVDNSPGRPPPGPLGDDAIAISLRFSASTATPRVRTGKGLSLRHGCQRLDHRDWVGQPPAFDDEAVRESVEDHLVEYDVSTGRCDTEVRRGVDECVPDELRDHVTALHLVDVFKVLLRERDGVQTGDLGQVVTRRCPSPSLVHHPTGTEAREEPGDVPVSIGLVPPSGDVTVRHRSNPRASRCITLGP